MTATRSYVHVFSYAAGSRLSAASRHYPLAGFYSDLFSFWGFGGFVTTVSDTRGWLFRVSIFFYTAPHLRLGDGGVVLTKKAYFVRFEDGLPKSGAMLGDGRVGLRSGISYACMITKDKTRLEGLLKLASEMLRNKIQSRYRFPQRRVSYNAGTLCYAPLPSSDRAKLPSLRRTRASLQVKLPMLDPLPRLHATPEN